MKHVIDLKKLSVSESEMVEWKENGDDKDVVQSIVKTITAFANDIANVGGGYVVCGAKEVKDEYGFQKLLYTGLSAEKVKRIEGKVFEHCRTHVSPSLVPQMDELENPCDPSSKILVFTMEASSHAHSYRDGETTNYYVRTGKETREARNGVFRQLLVAKQEMLPFDKRPNPAVNERDLDLLLFRDCMNEMELPKNAMPLESYLSDTEQIAEFVPPLCAKSSLDGALCLRNFALFLFGKKRAISLHFPDIFTSVSFYNGTDRSESVAVRYQFNGSIIEQTKETLKLLNTQAHTIFDKTSDNPNQVKYPTRALQEAVVNAIVHRDYELYEPTRITVFSDRIEIMSPGSLHWGVDRAMFIAGKASPKWRNQSFAYLFNKMRLSQSEGQGISTIIRTMKVEGCPEPIFELGAESVTCILPANPTYLKVKNLTQ